MQIWPPRGLLRDVGALQFVSGVMNMLWLAAVTILVLCEKLLPHGQWVGRATGAVLIVWSAATLVV